MYGHQSNGSLLSDAVILNQGLLVSQYSYNKMATQPTNLSPLMCCKTSCPLKHCFCRLCHVPMDIIIDMFGCVLIFYGDL